MERAPAAIPTEAAQPRGDAILRSTRIGAGVVLVLAAANGGFLYFASSRAEPDYAWPIAPAISAGFMGAGYLAGLVAAGLGLKARHWRSLHGVVWPLAVLSVGMCVATALHADRFRWGSPPAWGWTAVYVVIPPGAAYLWSRQAHAGSERVPADARLRWIRLLSAPLGAVLLLLGLVLLIAPQAGIDAWPWPLTPLLGRAFGSWYLLMGTLLVFAAATLARPHEVPIPYATLATWSGLVLLLPLLHGGAVEGGAALAAGLALHGLALALGVAALARGVVLMRGEGGRL